MDVEGLGMVFLEASATGLPVVAGDSGGAPDAVREGVTGLVVDGRDVGRGRPSGSAGCWPIRARAAGDGAGRAGAGSSRTGSGTRIADRLAELLEL